MPCSLSWTCLRATHRQAGWIAEITAHIPNKGEQLVRYYGYYSNASRGKRKKEKPEEQAVNRKPEVIEVATPPVSKELKKRWSYFIRKVYETDPLTCLKCQGDLSAVAQAGMRIISFIDQPEVIKKILQHLGLWEQSQAPPARDPPLKELTFRGEPKGRTFDPSYGSINSPSRGRSRDSQVI